MFSEISLPVLRPGHPWLAVTQTPSSLPFSKQTDDQNRAACQPDKPESSASLTSQSGQPHPNLPLVSKEEEGISTTTRPEPALQHSEMQKRGKKDEQKIENKERELGSTAGIQIHTDISRMHTDTKMTDIPSESNKSLQMRDDDDMKPSKSPSLNKHTHCTRSDSPQINFPTQSLTPDHNGSTKDQQLREEERFLLAKMHMMTGNTSPASCRHTMKRLIPAPGDIDCGATEPQSQSDVAAQLTDHNQLSLIPCFDDLQEISLTEAEEPLGEETV